MNQAKLFARDLFDEMVERKLWPVALILLVALIAIPVLLSKPASNSTAPLPGAAQTSPSVSGASSPLTAFEPVVSSTGTTSESKGLRGRVKNPFTPKGIDFAAANKAGSVEPVPGLGNTQVATGDTAVGAGDTAPPGDTKTGTTAPGSTQQGGTVFYTYTAKVRFGEEGNTKTRTLDQFRALPSADNPVAVFMGVKRDGKTAVFMLSSSTTTTGDGNCEPTESECTFLYLKPGDAQIVETVTTDGEIVTYDLELVSVDAKPTKVPSEAGSSSAKSSSKANASARRAAAHKAAREHRLALRAFSRLGF
jgi:hypothetical protein